ncbi:hypothetical protein GCM10010840_14610 [Deinococcus aerolatus]|uniref:CRISPR system Cms protein Csm4 n=1 Tax=Deinococcus aerolatus TaxID=522487 RepID=A0ABQ2G6A7_9DEIO|nr:hypothetical protein [Deinococcus aerolatus]GGL77787.1 hypothetical protein GCM10010840_14610 [Deinococcus aerolatus]
MGRHDLVVLTFTQPLRGRDLRAGYLPSDLLWGALFSADVLLQGGPLPLDNPYRVSSASPYAGGEWLLPRPRAADAPDDSGAESPSSDRKAVRKLEFVNLADFLTLAGGQRLGPEQLRQAEARQRRALLPVTAQDLPLTVTEAQVNRSLRGTRYDGRADALARERYAAPLAALSPAERLHLGREARGQGAGGSMERQRNAQDRVTQATETFMTATLAQPRLAFLLETTSDTQRARLLAALRLLADTGLGGLRTHGSGQFTLDLQPVPAGVADRLTAGGRHVLLGLTHPTREEAQLIDSSEQARYGLRRRDGFLDGTTLERQDVWMLTEGSLMPGPLGGQVVDVAPPDFAHPVWRSGLSVSLSIEQPGSAA